MCDTYKLKGTFYSEKDSNMTRQLKVKWGEIGLVSRRYHTWSSALYFFLISLKSMAVSGAVSVGFEQKDNEFSLLLQGVRKA